MRATVSVELLFPGMIGLGLDAQASRYSRRKPKINVTRNTAYTGSRNKPLPWNWLSRIIAVTSIH